MALLNFNAAEVEPSSTFEAIPAGNYEAVITDSQMKPTKAGTGSYLELAFEIIAGDYNGRRLWARLNLANPNPKAVEIAERELSGICRAVGVMQPKDSADLHNLPLVITVKTRNNQDGELTNEIKGYAARAAAPKPAAVATPTPVASAAPVTSGTPPWAR